MLLIQHVRAIREASGSGRGQGVVSLNLQAFNRSVNRLIYLDSADCVHVQEFREQPVTREGRVWYVCAVQS